MQTTIAKQEESTSPAALWYGVLAGPLAWALDEGLSYSLTQHACSTGHFYVLHVVSAVCFLLALSGALVAGRQLRAVRGDDPSHGRSVFMARLGIALGLGFALVVIAMAVPRWILSPCD